MLKDYKYQVAQRQSEAIHHFVTTSSRNKSATLTISLLSAMKFSSAALLALVVPLVAADTLKVHVFSELNCKGQFQFL
jgi:hypothetical protein